MWVGVDHSGLDIWVDLKDEAQVTQGFASEQGVHKIETKYETKFFLVPHLNVDFYVVFTES